MAGLAALLGASAAMSVGSNIVNNILAKNSQREMVDYVNEYNSPRHQAQLMQQGGFSPAALFGQNGSSISQMQSPSVSAPSYVPFTSESLMNPFSSVAQALQSITQANKNTAEIPLVEANIEKMFSDARLNDSYTALNRFTDKMNQIYGSSLKANEVRNLVRQGNLLSAQAELAGIHGDTEKARQLLAKSQSAYYDSMKGLTDEQMLQAKQETLYHVARIRSEIESNKAQALAHREQASLSHEQSIMQNLENNIKNATNLYDIDNAIYNADVLQLLTQSENKERAWKQLQEAVWNSNFVKNAEQAAKVEAALTRLAKIIGLHTSVSASAN